MRKIGVETNMITFFEAHEKHVYFLTPEKYVYVSAEMRHDQHVRSHWWL